MAITYHVASPAAILGGAVAALGATALLVRDAFATGWTIDHALAPVLVGLTILSGHLFWQAVRQWRPFSAIGLAFLTIFGSGLTVYETMGRRAEVRDVKVAAADDTEKQRRTAVKMLREAEEILAKHRAARDSECATGKGKACDGKSYTVATWEAAVAGYKAEIANLGTPKPVDPKAERVAAVLAFFNRAKDADVRQGVALLEPFAWPLFLEIGSIVLFSFGASSRRQNRSTATPAEQVTPASERRLPQLPAGGGKTKIEAERDLVMLLAMGTVIESQDWLADRWGVGKGTVSKWMADWEERGLVTRAQSGRCKQVVSA